MILLELAQWAAAILVAIGSLFCLLAAVGMLRLPDLYTRMHAASKAGAVGAGMVLLGAGIGAFDLATLARVVLGVGFILLTTPVSAHLLARAAWRTGNRPNPVTEVNELDTTILVNEMGKDQIKTKD